VLAQLDHPFQRPAQEFSLGPPGKHSRLDLIPPVGAHLQHDDDKHIVYRVDPGSLLPVLKPYEGWS